jgi:uncharacterized protein
MERSPRRRRWVDRLLHTHDTPRRTAAAFALGVLLGFSPLLGLHTVLALAFAFALRLNRIAVLIGVYSNLPWIMAPYYAITTIAGAAILGAAVPPDFLGRVTHAASGAGWSALRAVAEELAPLVWSFVLGSTLGAVTLAVIAYRGSLALILASRRHLERQHNHL